MLTFNIKYKLFRIYLEKFVHGQSIFLVFVTLFDWSSKRDRSLGRHGVHKPLRSLLLTIEKIIIKTTYSYLFETQSSFQLDPSMIKFNSGYYKYSLQINNHCLSVIMFPDT